MEEFVGIVEINTLIIEINTKFLKGKSQIGGSWNPEDGVTIYQSCEGDCNLTMEKGLSFVGAYCYLIGFKRGFTAPHWV